MDTVDLTKDSNFKNIFLHYLSSKFNFSHWPKKQKATFEERAFNLCRAVEVASYPSPMSSLLETRYSLFCKIYNSLVLELEVARTNQKKLEDEEEGREKKKRDERK